MAADTSLVAWFAAPWKGGGMANIGRWAFILGLVIAVVAGLGFGQVWFAWVLAVLGVIVGFLNIKGTEAQTFLLAAVGLIVSASAINTIPYIGPTATAIVANIVAFIGAAVLVVAIKTLLQTAKK
ncbi:MAG TPA: hypothetical protein VGB99_06185 [Acidobacteriota bacterium]